jgi:hypothetical protein
MSDTRIREAARALVARLDELHDHPKYVGIWTFCYAHGLLYTGPDYVEQLKALRDALEDQDG